MTMTMTTTTTTTLITSQSCRLANRLTTNQPSDNRISTHNLLTLVSRTLTMSQQVSDNKISTLSPQVSDNKISTQNPLGLVSKVSMTNHQVLDNKLLPSNHQMDTEHRRRHTEHQMHMELL